MAKTQKQMEEQDRWFSLVLDERYNCVRPWNSDGRDMKGPEATFIVIDDHKEWRHLVIVDPGFDENGRVPHNVVMQKFRDLGFANFRVLGGGVVERTSGNASYTLIKHYCSDTIGNVPKDHEKDVRQSLGI